ncbi:MAG: hypothetical protein NTX88_02315 [Candidatus Atribacteria bacterium]|nr:hypothetical protein [Candidatus Atribacteria bacterium]
MQTKTDENGEWSVSGLSSSCYILEAVRDGLTIKASFCVEPGKSNDAGEANAYTSSQVLIYEIANELFKNALYIREVPDLVIPEELVNAVKNVYRECRNPFTDHPIHDQVQSIVNHQL